MHRAELLEEIAGRYGVAAEYPWRRYPQYAVFRHAGNRKWFAVLMNPPGRKLGLATEDEVAILNVKIRAGENSLLRGMDAVLPADLPALVATLTRHIADLSATQDNLADSLAALPADYPAKPVCRLGTPNERPPLHPRHAAHNNARTPRPHQRRTQLRRLP